MKNVSPIRNMKSTADLDQYGLDILRGLARDRGKDLFHLGGVVIKSSEFENEIKAIEKMFLGFTSLFFWHHKGYTLKRDGWYLIAASGKHIPQFAKVDGIREMLASYEKEVPF